VNIFAPCLLLFGLCDLSYLLGEAMGDTGGGYRDIVM